MDDGVNARSNLRVGLMAITLAVLLGARPAAATDGHVMHGIGAVNEALGGAGIATSIDAIGSNSNNVSSIAYLGKNSVEFGAEVFIPDRSLYSSINGLAAGTVDSKTRESVIPSFGLVYQIDDQWSAGFSGVGISGFGVDYPAVLPNATGNFSPLSVPQSYGGLGSIYSNYQLLQMTPSVAYKVLPNLSIGLGVNIDWSSLSVSPWPATPPNASGYPTATHTANAWGGGFTVGATYRPLPDLAVGLTFKSPQWFGSFDWNSQYPDGTPTNFKFRLDYPLIVGIGGSYAFTEQWLLASDLKWINYANTSGFEKENFAPTAQGPYVRGMGWDNILAFAIGVQYKVIPRLPLRLGYNFGQNPIPANQQFFNVISPAIVQHHLTAGFGFDLTSAVTLNFAYTHGFQNQASGPIISNGGPGYPPLNQPIPGTQVTNKLSEDAVSLQAALKF